MNLTVHLTDVMAKMELSRSDDGRTTKTLDVSPTATIGDVRDSLRIMCFSVDYERYYRVCDPNCREGNVPYVISDGRVRWNPDVYSVTLADFFSTHNIESDEIYILHGWPAAGGMGWADIAALWKDVHHAITYIAPMISTGIVSAKLLAWLHAKVSPGSAFSLVSSRPRWTAIELAALINLSKEEAKELLRLCGYKYDRHSHMYCETPASKESIATLKRHNWTRKSGLPPQA